MDEDRCRADSLGSSELTEGLARQAAGGLNPTIRVDAATRK